MKSRSFIRNLGALLRGHFFTGMLVVLPLGVIAWIMGAAVGTLWQLQSLLPLSLRPENVFENHSVALLVSVAITFGMALILAFVVSLVGWSSKHYLGRKFLEFIAEVIQFIPIIRSIYSALDQLLKTMTSGGGQQFNRVVYVEYPRKGCWTLAFVTSPVTHPQFAAEKHLNLYVPTTPNPTSGFHLIVPESEVRDSQMKVEEAFKTILSLGIAQNTAPAPSTPSTKIG